MKTLIALAVCFFISHATWSQARPKQDSVKSNAEPAKPAKVDESKTEYKENYSSPLINRIAVSDPGMPAEKDSTPAKTRQAKPRTKSQKAKRDSSAAPK